MCVSIVKQNFIFQINNVSKGTHYIPFIKFGEFPIPFLTVRTMNYISSYYCKRRHKPRNTESYPEQGKSAIKSLSIDEKMG